MKKTPNPQTPINIPLPADKRVFFASDQHFGVPDHTRSLVRERLFVDWLDEIKPGCAALFIPGDLFDFWFEYKNVVPKYYVRVLAKLAEFTDSGIPVYFFAGNHDMWVRNYFTKELGVTVFMDRQDFMIAGKAFQIGHGDGLGPGDHGFKGMKRLFRNPLAQWLFEWLIHPNWSLGIANYFSRKSRLANGDSDQKWLGDDKEWLLTYCHDILKSRHYDYFVFGHRHFPVKKQAGEDSWYINLGDWVRYYTYGEFDGQDFIVREYKKPSI